MACCIALALVISVVRTGWFRLVRRQAPPRVGFAPPARRPAPTEAAPTDAAVARNHSDAVLDVSVRPSTRQQPAATALVVVLSAVVGLGLYSELLALLVHAGLATVTGDPAAWRIREIALVVGAAVAAMAGFTARLHRPAPAQRRRRFALALTGAGGAWSLLSVVDMHLTGLVPDYLVNPFTDLVLHGPGFLAVTSGLGALLAGDRWLNSLSPSTTRGSS